MGIKYMIFTLIFSVIAIFTFSNNEVKAEEQIKVDSIESFSNEVQNNLKTYNTSFEIKYVGDMSEFQQEVRKIIPKIILKDDMVAGTLKQYQQTVQTNSEEGLIKYKINYFTTKSYDAKADALIKKQVALIKKKAKTDFEKVKAVNDFVVQNTTYGGKTVKRHTAYGLMYDKLAVCQGYALTTYKMLKELKIPVRYVVGTSNNQDHAWNKVKVSGVWYNLDTTWNDPLPNSPTEVQYNYFLISDAQLQKDHSWDKKNYPASNSKKYDFLADASSAVLVGSVFYYSNSKDNEKLYSYSLKTSKKKKVSNTRVQYLTYAKSKLFFSNYSNGAYLSSISTSGKSLKVLNKKKSQNLQVKGSYLYYKIGSKNYKMKI